MIKTTTLAPPRPSHPSSPTRGRQSAIKAAKARATAQPTLASLFPVPAPTPEISASQAREIIQSAAPKSKPKPKAAPVAKVAPPAPVVQVAPPIVETPAPSAPVAPRKSTRAAKSTPVLPIETPAVVAPPKIEAAPAEPVTAPAVVVPAPPKVAVAPVPKKGKRARVPANLAEQYGQNLSKRVENGVEAVSDEDESPKKRLSRAERAARRELMKPDDDLRARLERVQNAAPTIRTEKRPRGWRFDCGRCGQTSYFQTSGALCNCGALALKD